MSIKYLPVGHTHEDVGTTLSCMLTVLQDLSIIVCGMLKASSAHRGELRCLLWVVDHDYQGKY